MASSEDHYGIVRGSSGNHQGLITSFGDHEAVAWLEDPYKASSMWQCLVCFVNRNQARKGQLSRPGPSTSLKGGRGSCGSFLGGF